MASFVGATTPPGTTEDNRILFAYFVLHFYLLSAREREREREREASGREGEIFGFLV